MDVRKDTVANATEIALDSKCHSLGSQSSVTPVWPAARITHWPSDPQPLANNRWEEIGYIIYDVVLCALPLALMVKAVLVVIAWRWDRSILFADEVSKLTTFLLNFNSQLTTGFTIVFATIMTTSMRRLALYMAQRGATIGELEQFQASISLPSTIKLVWSLRAYNFTSVGLVSIWAFYYLGSQACKDEYQYVNSGRYKTFEIAYMESTAPSLFESRNSSSEFEYAVSTANQAFACSLLTQYDGLQQGTSIDGTPILPYLNLDGEDDTVDLTNRHGWRDVSKASNTQKTSLVGYGTINNQGDSEGFFYSAQMIGSYTFNSSYLVANCSLISNLPASEFPHGTLPGLALSLNATSPSELSTNDPSIFNVYYKWNSTLIMQSSCNITVQNVEVAVNCGAQGCAPRRMRARPGVAFVTNDTPFKNASFTAYFFDQFLKSTGVPGKNNQQNLLEQATDFKTWIDPEMSVVNPIFAQETLSTDLTWLFNTYYTETQKSGPAGSVNSLTNARNSPYFAITTMKGAVYNPHYALSIPWLTVDFLSCKILLCAAILSFWLRKRTLAPDIFGYVSSLTRDNPNLQLPETGTTLSGLERARLLKNVKVRIGNTGGEGVGKVGLKYYQPQPEHHHDPELRWEKRYL